MEVPKARGDNMKRLSVWLPANLVKRLKRWAVDNDMNLQEAVNYLTEHAIANPPPPPKKQ